METRQQLKSLPEYVEDLVQAAPAEVVAKYLECIRQGRKIQAIRILREYGLITL